jgi:hypothetical protein
MMALLIALVGLISLTLGVDLTRRATWWRVRGRGPPTQASEYAVDRPVELRIVRVDGRNQGHNH